VGEATEGPLSAADAAVLFSPRPSFSLENYDLIGKWRDADSGTPVNAAGQLVDGTMLDGPASLRQELLDRREAVVSLRAMFAWTPCDVQWRDAFSIWTKPISVRASETPQPHQTRSAWHSRRSTAWARAQKLRSARVPVIDSGRIHAIACWHGVRLPVSSGRVLGDLRTTATLAQHALSDCPRPLRDVPFAGGVDPGRRRVAAVHRTGVQGFSAVRCWPVPAVAVACA
jgi:hypothetical protein